MRYFLVLLPILLIACAAPTEYCETRVVKRICKAGMTDEGFIKEDCYEVIQTSPCGNSE